VQPAAATIAAFDDAAERALDRLRGPAADAVFHTCSIAADHSLVWHWCGAARALRRGGDLRYAARFAAAIGIESFVTNALVKSLFRRVRPAAPRDLDLPAGMHRPITSSFPSGHATSAFCAATLLGPGNATAPAWYAAATLVAASRVYVRLHHASDAAAGAALGVALGILLRRVLLPEGESPR
jgi:undecaprenyl-diphosphatase